MAENQAEFKIGNLDQAKAAIQRGTAENIGGRWIISLGSPFAFRQSVTRRATKAELVFLEQAMTLVCRACLGTGQCEECGGDGCCQECCCDGSCPECDGMGHWEGEECGTCDGTGDCLECDGSGQCFWCDGNGDCPDCEGKRFED